MRHDPINPAMPDRDRFLLSAGHKSLVQYAALCESGYFPEELLDTYGCLHCKMPGHPDKRKIPGIEANTGALGHGLAIACGMALGVRSMGYGSRIFVVMGDGELAEGMNWEAAAAAAHHKLDNICVVVDNNHLQISGAVEEVMSFQPVAEHFAGFGWVTREIDGHDMSRIVGALDALPFEKGKPSLIVAQTTKGKGYSKAENVGAYHFWLPAEGELDKAEEENREVLKRYES